MHTIQTREVKSTFTARYTGNPFSHLFPVSQAMKSAEPSPTICLLSSHPSPPLHADVVPRSYYWKSCLLWAGQAAARAVKHHQRCRHKVSIKVAAGSAGDCSALTASGSLGDYRCKRWDGFRFRFVASARQQRAAHRVCLEGCRAGCSASAPASNQEAIHPPLVTSAVNTPSRHILVTIA